MTTPPILDAASSDKLPSPSVDAGLSRPVVFPPVPVLAGSIRAARNPLHYDDFVLRERKTTDRHDPEIRPMTLDGRRSSVGFVQISFSPLRADKTFVEIVFPESR